jgi:hypothetical protein
MPEATVHLDLLDFEVRNRGQELRIPIDQALVLVDQAVFIERNENFEDSLRQSLVHGKAFARPVARCAEPLQLIEDQPAGFGLPFPDLVDEGVTAHLAALYLPFHQLALNDHLRGDARVIHARLPEHILATHALEADHDVLQRIVQRVAHMQRACHVRWRDDHAKAVGARFCPSTCTEGVLVIPGLGDARFDSGGIIGFFKHFGAKLAD